MAIAVLATSSGPARHRRPAYAWIVGALVVGGGVGLFAAKKVQMTQMPELVALMHSLVGLAGRLVGYASYVDTSTVPRPAEKAIHEIEIYVGIPHRRRHLSGSVIAFGKLSGASAASRCCCRRATGSTSPALLVVIWFGRAFLNAHDVAEA